MKKERTNERTNERKKLLQDRTIQNEMMVLLLVYNNQQNIEIYI